MLGEPGTEQFTIVTKVDGEEIRTQSIHDPFLTNTTILRLSRWQALKQFFRPKDIKVVVSVRGTQAVVRAVMTMDAEALCREEKEIKEQVRSRHIENSNTCEEIVQFGGSSR